MSLVKSTILKNWRLTSVDYIDRKLSGLARVLSLKGQNDNIAATTLFDSKASMLVRVTVYRVLTTVDAVSSTLPQVTIGWTDADNSTALTVTVVTTNAGNTKATFGTSSQGSIVINKKGGVDVTYATTGYLSNTANAMQYSLYITVEEL